jgi:hypothetical protein
MLPSSKKTLLGSVALFTLISSTFAVDPCSLIAGNKTTSFENARACLDYFKYDKEIAQQTVDTVRKVTNELYVFNVITKLHPLLKKTKQIITLYPNIGSRRLATKC